MKGIVFLIKTVALCLFATIYNKVITAITPIVANYLAMEQMANSSTSSVGIELFTLFSQNTSWYIGIVALLVYMTDIVDLIMRLVEKKDGKNNEEK